MDKKSFVEKHLERLVVEAIDPKVQQLVYKSTDGQEIVEIHWIASKKTVDVTADSLKAIAVDVLKRIG